MRPLRAAAAALAPALLAVAPAQADQQVVAAPVTRYVEPLVTIAAGERLTFASEDPLLPHNVTAKSSGPDGRPLFASATIAGGQTTPVAGAERLAAGSYGFFCTVHPAQMNGTLVVRAAPAAADTTPPALRARVDGAGLRALQRGRALRVTLTSDEPATAAVAVRAFDVTLARRSVSLPSGSTAVALKLTAAGLRGVRRRSQVNLRLRVVARDAAGNRATATARRTLRR